MTSIHSSQASVSIVPTLHFASRSSAPLHRSSVLSPPPYSRPSPAPRQSPMVPPSDQTQQVHGKDDHSSTTGARTTHIYGLKECAYVFINSHANSPEDTPMIYWGEETTGTIQIPQRHLQEVKSIIVVLRVFESDPANPTFKIKAAMLSGQIDPSHIRGEDFCGPIAIAPPTSVTHDSNLKFELQITIHRRGRLTRKIRMKQPIRYSTRPDPSSRLPPSEIRARKPRNLPSSWTANDYPGVIVRGIIFQRQHEVEVECKLVIPVSYPVCDSIPLHLIMTCVDREALELFAVSGAINVRLLQVLAFGKKAAKASPPFNLKNRKSYHITKWVATAHWYVDGSDKEVPPDDRHSVSRWRTKLNGEFLREPSAEISHSFAEPGMAVMYYVCLFPFRASDFHPTSNPDKVLFYGQISLSK
ncbi:hypothetical protein H4582DRAFT_1966249 [Lactarius indigo]|nr:hypothetical protein H4582DRAFT_2006973 [Lactarius indigo]KAI9435916.1 hypothetical protein H4582DRAFT_1966249 [Lactarius indigo]